MTETRETPRVWIGCLACYNAGRLVGQWVDAIEAGDHDAAAVHAEMIGTGRAVATEGGDVFVTADGPCPHEELWCMDLEGFGAMLTEECSPAEAQTMAEILARVEEETGGEADAFAAYVGYIGRLYASQDWDAAVDGFQDAFCGMWESERDYAMNFAEDIGAINEDATWPNSYIDWDRATAELFSGDWTSVDAAGGVFVFRCI